MRDDELPTGSGTTGPPRVLDGRFALERRLGGGGMGLVWMAQDLVLRRFVAVKEVRPGDPGLAEADSAAADLLRERVLREAQALARLDHPGVVTIHHVVDGGPGTFPWLVMELVPGGSLEDRLREGPTSPGEAARLGRKLLSALRAAHEAGVEHRDVKPANVLLRSDGSPVLTDFGIAALHESPHLTAAGSLIGSPAYMAPERVAGQGRGGPGSDLWSLGMLLYEAVEGRNPLRRGGTYATLVAVLEEEIPKPTRAGPLTGVLAALLRRDPADRLGAEELAVALEQAAEAADEAGPGRPAVLPRPADEAADEAPDGVSDAAPARTEPADAEPAHAPTDAEPADAEPRKQDQPPAEDEEDAPTIRLRPLVGALTALAVGTAALVVPIVLPGPEATRAPHSDRPSASPSSSGALTPPPADPRPGPDYTRPNLVRHLAKRLESSAGTAEVLFFSVTTGSAAATVPVAGKPDRYRNYQYVTGEGWRSLGSHTSPRADRRPFDLATFDWERLPGLYEKADDELTFPGKATRTFRVQAGPAPQGVVPGGPAQLSVELNDGMRIGWISAEPGGKVTEVNQPVQYAFSPRPGSTPG